MNEAQAEIIIAGQKTMRNRFTLFVIGFLVFVLSNYISASSPSRTDMNRLMDRVDAMAEFDGLLLEALKDPKDDTAKKLEVLFLRRIKNGPKSTAD